MSKQLYVVEIIRHKRASAEWKPVYVAKDACPQDVILAACDRYSVLPNEVTAFRRL